jgi:hypothetical protein
MFGLRKIKSRTTLALVGELAQEETSEIFYASENPQARFLLDRGFGQGGF